MFNNFTDRAKKVMNLARKEALRLENDSVDTEHILLGLVREGEGVAASVLRKMGCDLGAIRDRVMELAPVGWSRRARVQPFTPAAKQVLELAREASVEIHHRYIGTEHLLLGLIREHEGIAGQVLANLGLTFSNVRSEVLEFLGCDVGFEVLGTIERLPVAHPHGLRAGVAGSLVSFLEREDAVLREGRLGLLCNHASFDPGLGEYLFTALARGRDLRRLFVPEHGLFAELQDQVPLAGAELYSELGLAADIVSLYGESEGTLRVRPELLEDLDALVVDIHDVGSRYYTYATTLSYIFDVLAIAQRSLPVFVIDRPNPAGRQVEGTILQPEYASFVGRAGLPHRHGLTIAELAAFYRDQTGAPVDLVVHPIPEAAVPDPRIPPSPNMPSPWTPLVYTGQCLLEGTNLSEGRGTTRPFEIFGAPWMDWIWNEEAPAAAGAVLRPMQFVPAFHKHAGTLCHGFQILLTGEPYHSLAHSLRLLRWIRERADAFAWRTEEYEFRSDRPAIEILAGDPVLLDYLRGEGSLESVTAALAAGEEDWIRRAAGYAAAPLFRGGHVAAAGS